MSASFANALRLHVHVGTVTVRGDGHCLALPRDFVKSLVCIQPCMNYPHFLRIFSRAPVSIQAASWTGPIRRGMADCVR